MRKLFFKGCLKSCHQKNIIKTCNFGDPQYPMPRNIPDINKYCDLFSSILSNYIGVIHTVH